MATAVGWAPIIKSEKRDDGTLVITGRAADSSLDRDFQIADPAWLDSAMSKWFGAPDGGNIREQHDGKRAIGNAVEYRKGNDGGHYVTAEIVDPLAITKIEKNVLKGFSWSARNAAVVVDKAAPGGRINRGDIYELSVVDRPSNPGCLITIAKADGPDGDADLELVEEPELVEVDKADTHVIEKTDEPKFTPTQFAELLKSLGKTPEPADGEDVEKKDSTDELLSNQDKARQVLADVRALVPAAIAKADGDAFDPDTEASDVDNGTSAIAAIARLIISEAEGLAVGRMEELWDIQTLVDAACALQCFVSSERFEEAELAMTEPAKADNPDNIPAATETSETTGDETTKTEDASKTEPSVDVIDKTDAPTEGADKTASPTEGLTKTDLSELLETTIAKAVQPYKDELDLVKADLAKVLETPRPDGPARTRTTTHTAVAAKADVLRAEIALCQKSIPITSGDMQKGYRQRLDLAEEELTKLDGAA